MNFATTSLLRNISSGITDTKIYRLLARVLAKPDETVESEHLELVLGEQEEKLVQERTLKVIGYMDSSKLWMNRLSDLMELEHFPINLYPLVLALDRGNQPSFSLIIVGIARSRISVYKKQTLLLFRTGDCEDPKGKRFHEQIPI